MKKRVVRFLGMTAGLGVLCLALMANDNKGCGRQEDKREYSCQCTADGTIFASDALTAASEPDAVKSMNHRHEKECTGGHTATCKALPPPEQIP